MDRDELAEVVRAYQAGLYRYVRYLGASSSTAEDLVQDAFLVAFRKADGLAGGGEARSAWLRGVARNLFLRHCRREHRNPTLVDAASLEQAEAIWTAEFLRGGDGFDYVEALRECLKALPDDRRHAIDLRYRDRTTRAEMARLLGMTENGVKSLLRRVRRSLADCIRRRLALEEI
jgi:RNA polymerase sigma-70 factor (ECF subfamily)